METLRAVAPDLKESLEIGREGVVGMPNMWPGGVGEGTGTGKGVDVGMEKGVESAMEKDKVDEQWASEFRRDMLAFYDQCQQLHVLVMRSIAVGLGIDATWFDGHVDQGDNTLRLLHYPPVKREVFERNRAQVRAGAHSDYGS